MAVPFSTTHLRVPRGFGTILEGLVREVLRDQPEDIPKYAAQYFSGLLKQRQESGVDPAEWAAKLEDRFYNNHAFETGPSAEPKRRSIISQENPHKTRTGAESVHSAEALPLSAVPPEVSEEVDITDVTEEEESVDIGEKHTSLEDGHSEEGSVDRLALLDVQSEELSGTDHEKNPVMTTGDQVDLAANENRSMSPPNTNIPQPESQHSDLSLKGVSNVDVCAQELGMAADWHEQEAAVGDKETGESQRTQSAEVAEPLEVVPHTGRADVNVCAEELQTAEITMEGASVGDDLSGAHAIKEETPQMEEIAALSSPFQPENPECSQRQREDRAVMTAEKNKTETKGGSDETHETEASTDNEQRLHMRDGPEDHAAPMEDSLVEVCFEDVPEVEQITDAAVDEESADLQTKILETQESKQTDHNICEPQDHEEPEMEAPEKDAKSNWEEMENQQEAFDVMKEDLQTDILENQDDESKQVSAKGTDHNICDTQDHEEPEMEAPEKDAKSNWEEMESQQEAFDVMKEDLQTDMLENQDHESKQVSAKGTDHNICDTQDHEEPEMEAPEKDAKSDWEEMESQQEAFDIMKKKVDTSESDSSDGDSDKRDAEDSSYHCITETKEKSPEGETDHEKEDRDKKSEVEPRQDVDSEKETKCEPDDADSKEEEMTDTDGEEDSSHMEDTEGGAENSSSKVAQSNLSMTELEEESASFEVSAQHLSEDEERTLKEIEDTSKEPTLERGNLKEGQADSEVGVPSGPLCDEVLIRSSHCTDPTAAEDHGQQRPLQSVKDPTQSQTPPGDVTEVRGRSRGPSGSGAAASREEDERVEALQRDRREVTERLIQEMSLEEHRQLTAQLLERQPGLLFDALMMYQRRHGAPPVGQVPGVPWCTCGHCRDVATDGKRNCCGQDPDYCFSLLPHFSHYCLDEGYLRIHRQYREDVAVLAQVTQPGDDNREYRYAAYRHFIFWQHGSLGQGNQCVVPSCCVWRIRDKFPDPQGHDAAELLQLME